MVQWDSPPWSFARFWFNIRTKRVTCGVTGTTHQGSDQVSLLATYRVDGQRFWTDTSRDYGFKDTDNPTPEALEYNATTWKQGPYAVELLRRHRQGYVRGFVLQSDHWANDKVFAPSFFDDHDRKYLITASPIFENAGDGGDGVNPAMIGAFGLGGFLGLQPNGQGAPGPAQPSIQAQIIKDGLNLLKPWKGDSPGVKAQLIGLGNGEYQVLPKPQTEQILADAKFTAGGATVVLGDAPTPTPEPTTVCLTLETHHHPFTQLLVTALNTHGVRGLYDPTDSKLLRQSALEHPLDANHLDANPEAVRAPFPVDEFDFSAHGAYSAYNWELFFHAPLLIANKLTTARRFEEAQRYLHAIFNPIDRIVGPDESNGSGLWRMRQFVQDAKAGELFSLHAMLGIGVTEAQKLAAIDSFAKQVQVWLANPFDPHAVAQLRPGAYMRAVVMRYLDNLIAWADELFRRDSIESIDEARILYMLAAELLGPRPQQMPAQKSLAKSYVQLAAELDAFANAAQMLENWVYVEPGDALLLADDIEAGWNLVEMRFWYFCYPPNPKLLGYWDTIEDRLWKIRHCQNIKGITRQLPLFQPPIDPSLLIAATAAGLSIDAVLSDLAVGLPPYRFRHVLAKAMDFCNELRGLGGALLATLEKRDADQLAQLRAGQEVSLLRAARDIRVDQIEDIEARIEALEWSETAAQRRIDYYQGLLQAGISEGETQHQLALGQAKERTVMMQGTAALATTLGVIPQLSVGTGAMSEFGGVQLSSVVRMFADWMQLGITDANFQANKALVDAQYERRAQEWNFQLGQAAIDQQRVRRELAAAAIQLAIAKRELTNHDLRTAQAREVDEYLRDEYTNAELYDWMNSRLLDVYYQVYDLAFDMAKRAEAAYRHELAVDGGAAIISSGYWEAQRQGLLAGERLSKDLRRLEKAYMERDVREYELRKNVSLAQLNPTALRSLQETGVCEFVVPEVVFDLDHPGHYLRRIRSVSVTIPAVVSTYTSLGAKLTLLEDHVRRQPGGPLETHVGGTQMIATSTAVGDAGLFQLDFRDERYLPFEYAGAVSKWRLELPTVLRQFDYRSITDAVVSLAYTAREGGDGYRVNVQNGLVADFNALFSGGASQPIVIHDTFPYEWEQFLEPDEGVDTQTLTPSFDAASLPYFARRHGLTIERVEFALLLNDGVTALGAGVLSLDVGGAQHPLTLAPMFNGASCLVGGVDLNLVEPLGEWTLRRLQSDQPDQIDALDDLTTGLLDRSKIAGMVMVIRYALA